MMKFMFILPSRAGSPYEYESATYDISFNEFLSLGKVYPVDHEKILLERDRASKNGFIRQDKAFICIDLSSRSV